MTLSEYLDDLTLADFVEALLRCHAGKIVACNILCGVDDGLCDDALVKEIVDWWHELFRYRWKQEAAAYSGPVPPPIEEFEQQAMDALDALALDSQDPGFLSGRAEPEFRLRCRRRPRLKAVSEGFVNVTPVQGLLFHLVSESERRRLVAGRGVVVETEPTDEEIDAFALGGEVTIGLRTDPVGPRPRTLGRYEGVLWLTPTQGVEADLAASDAADRLRDVLGLIHINAGRALAAVHLSADIIDRAETGRPTFADAGAHARFSARPDLTTHRRLTAWGYTADLERFAGGVAAIDGRLERVAKPIQTNDVATVRATPLGHTSETRGENCGGSCRDYHKAFSEKLCAVHGGAARVRRRMFSAKRGQAKRGQTTFLCYTSERPGGPRGWSRCPDAQESLPPVFRCA